MKNGKKSPKELYAEGSINKEALTKAFLTPNFFRRVVTALLFGGLTLWMLVIESPFIGYFMTVLCAILLIEWTMLVFKSDKDHKERMTWLLFGSTYLILGVLGFYELYDYSAMLGISLLFIIWSTDIGAYFTGKIIGGPRLAPTISPGKTWSGAIGGLISASITALIISVYMYDGINWGIVGFFILCSLLGQVGDLLESKVKRYFKIKDSSKFLPGHGGFIDRLDSLVFVGLFLYAFYKITNFSQIFNL